MRVVATALPEVLRLEPVVYQDARGLFLESYHQARFREATGLVLDFVQDNHSRSAPTVLRGLHYQLGRPQGKLIRVLRGRIYDVAVDLRRSSPRFGQWVAETLDAEQHHQLWIPPGFAHGFLALAEGAEVAYKTTDYYAPAEERTLLWNDPALGIPWPLAPGQAPLLSAKDERGQPLSAAETYP
ncbi:MAG TPA: dTDP-4-dehydrorhamnose 3,5-epimerase [Nevskiaceae bacterium]|nr:dTDP-4-dehydrorhamnose 3,5-epimerase [Nevskiaceae bacterium]